MNGKVIQIASILTPAGVALYALTDTGNIYEKLVGHPFAKWVKVSTDQFLTYFASKIAEAKGSHNLSA